MRRSIDWHFYIYYFGMDSFEVKFLAQVRNEDFLCVLTASVAVCSFFFEFV